VDGDLAIRAGRRLMIDSQKNLVLVYEESDAALALEKIPNLLVDVIVIDHRLKGFDGIELARRLVDAYSARGELCPHLIITGTYATPELVLAAIRAGASDVVTQDAPMSELLVAINNSALDSFQWNALGLSDVLAKANYVAMPDPLFLLRLSQIEPVHRELVERVGAAASADSLLASCGLPEAAFSALMESTLIDLHMATLDQLRLALHDASLS
jgi:CheY-like chemotaxis protein